MNGKTTRLPTAIVAGTNGKSALKRFIPSGGIILALTGPAKGWSAIGPVRALDVADQIVGTPFT